jgi:hypothetical protein
VDVVIRPGAEVDADGVAPAIRLGVDAQSGARPG